MDQTITMNPFEYFDTEKDATGWRSRVAWPLSHRDEFENSRRLVDDYLKLVQSIQDEDDRNILILSGGRSVAVFSALQLSAIAIGRSKASGMDFEVNNKFVQIFSGLAKPADFNFNPHSFFKPFGSPGSLWLRRKVRAASLNQGASKLLAMVTNDPVAISHNALLIEYCNKTKKSIGFRHAEGLYQELIRNQSGLTGINDRVERLTALVLDTVLTSTPVPDETKETFANLVEEFAAFLIEQSARELGAAQRTRHLPKTILSGSGGFWPTRLISLEVLRRGGESLKFDHAGQGGLLSVTGPIALSEMAVSSQYTVATEATAQLLKKSGALEQVSNYRRVRVEGMQGEPHLRHLTLERSETNRKRRKVLYGPTIMVGDRQISPVLPPDPIHLDHQFRMVEALTKMPVDLFLRPHPEGLLRGRKHPLSVLCEPQNENYEALLRHADVCVFEYLRSSTFYQALVSDRPIVIMDLQTPIFQDEVMDMLRRRCRFVSVRYDDRNRTSFDEEEFREAICGGPDHADPSEFIELLVGRAA